MNKFQLFRLGRYLVLGETKGTDGSYTRLQALYAATGGKWEPVIPCDMRVSEAFIINSDYPSENIAASIKENSSPIEIGKVVKESLAPHLGFGKIHLGYSEIVALDNGVWISESGDRPNCLDPADVLSSVQIGQILALEALRSKLETLGLIEKHSFKPVTEGFVSLSKPVVVFMKVEPFKDITKINEGVTVSVDGYYKGCAVVEADGELFWRPLEESTFWDKKVKDKAYYFTMDSNKDFIPDPLQALPSKPALGAVPARKEDNYNTQPDLRKVAGHFSPQEEISMEEFNILGEGFGAIYHEYYERGDNDSMPKDLGNEPGLEPTDYDDKVDDFFDTKAKKSGERYQGKDATPQNYSGDKVDEPTEFDEAAFGVDVQVEAVSKLLRELGFAAASRDVSASNVQRYAQWVVNILKKSGDAAKMGKFTALMKSLGFEIRETSVEDAMKAVMEGADIDFVLGDGITQKAVFEEEYRKSIKAIFPGA